MGHYRSNAKWLTYFAPFRALSISAAYLTPFFLQKGLSLSQILLLQSVYSIASLLWELPSGYIADRFGRAFSIKISAPIAGFAMVGYGLSSHFSQFVVWEVVLALANGLISGIDTALLLDSLKADGLEKRFVKLSQRMSAFGFGATAMGVPIAFLLVKYVSLSSTLVVDGFLTFIGAFFVFKLREAPTLSETAEDVRISAWHAIKKLSKNAEARWLIIFGSTLSTATYLGFWLTTPYYQSMGISVIFFSAILAVRSLWKAWLSHKFTQERHVERNMLLYAVLAGLVYVGMASGQVWLVWVVLGHDVVQALQGQPITAQLNAHIHHEYRATMNSLVNLIQRLAYSLAGPIAGWLIEVTNLHVGFLVIGGVCSLVSLVALAQLRRFKTFRS